MAYSEIRGAGMERVLIVSRGTKNALGDRRKFSGLMPLAVLDRYGFADPDLFVDPFEVLISQ